MPSITCIDKFQPALQKKKRVKIFVGGRGSTKTTFVADNCLAQTTQGKIWCCSREYLNSINDSVHRTLLDETERCNFEDFYEKNNQYHHPSGGRAFYKGLARNIESLKGMLSGVDVLWIEEGETVTDETLRVLTASLRVSAKDAQRVLDGEITEEELGIPEVWITMNRRSREDAIAKRYLARAEADLERYGYYEDDTIMIIQANYDDMPKKWFMLSGLDAERRDDLARLSRAEYDHKWHGRYLEDVEHSIIKAEWFESAVDAIDKLKLRNHVLSASIVGAFDPADVGGDAKGYAFRQGIHFFDVGECMIEDGNAACDEVTALARQHDCELFVWDGDGMGALLRRQVEQAFKRCETRMYKGSNSVDDPDVPYEGSWAEGQKTNKQMFHNKRAQYYTKLAERFYATHRAVEKGEYIDPDLLISIDGNMKSLNKLKAETCRIPRKINATTGKIQIMSKDEMKRKYKIDSPNMADCLAMSMESPDVTKTRTKIRFESFW